ncbi:MAG: dTMP kinase [Leptonema sp. (in: bacteria)]
MNFFVIEGIDGSGKTTIIQTIQTMVMKLKLNECFLFLKEPTNLDTGKKIRNSLQQNKNLTQKEWLKLFEEDRNKNIQYNILPNQKKIIIQDRYYFSTAAYQATHKEEALEILYYFYYKFPTPKIVFFIDIDISTALSRIQKRKQNIEQFEKKQELERIYKNYEVILNELKNLKLEFNIIQGNQKSVALAKLILKKVFSVLE